MESMAIITRIMTRHGIIMLLSGYVAEMQEEETTQIAACVGKEDFLLHCLVKRGTYVRVCAQVKKKMRNLQIIGNFAKSGGREGNEFLVCTLEQLSQPIHNQAREIVRSAIKVGKILLKGQEKM